MERYRGGQPGNQNARTHGFYSKKLVGDQKQDFEQAGLIVGLDEEITLLRVKIKALVEHDADNVRLIEQAVKTLARLITVKYSIHQYDPAPFEQALENVVRHIIMPTGVDPMTLLKSSRTGEDGPEFTPHPACPPWY